MTLWRNNKWEECLLNHCYNETRLSGGPEKDMKMCKVWRQIEAQTKLKSLFKQEVDTYIDDYIATSLNSIIIKEKNCSLYIICEKFNLILNTGNKKKPFNWVHGIMFDNSLSSCPWMNVFVFK